MAPADTKVPLAAELSPVSSQKGAQVGDENLAPVHEPEVSTNIGDQPAQVAPERDRPPSTLHVQETHIALDRQITDPSSPEAVQIPDAGRGVLYLPINRLTGPRVEDVFSGEAEAAPAPQQTSPAA